MSSLRRTLGRVARPLLPGWPDAGRQIVQRPVLGAMLARAAREQCCQIVLNAGSGEGLFASLLLATCDPTLQVEMDLSTGGARHLRSSRQRYIVASLTEVPLVSASVDLVLCSEVLEHIPGDGAAVAEIARVLRPDGWLVMSVPTPPAVPDVNHVREGYTLEQLSSLLGLHGLRCLQSRTCMHWFFRSVLQWWRPGRMPKLMIVGAAWLDRALPLGPPMDLVVLARKQSQAVELRIQSR